MKVRVKKREKHEQGRWKRSREKINSMVHYICTAGTAPGWRCAYLQLIQEN